MRAGTRTAPPHRVRLSVPAADTSTLEWLACQDNISQSVRALVRDYIERNGYTDPTSRPVRQLPRRGRPPLDEQRLDQQDAHGDDTEQGRAEAEQPRPQPVKRPESQPVKQAAPRQRQVAEPVATTAASAAPAPPVRDPGSTPGASGVGSFLSASRGDDD